MCGIFGIFNESDICNNMTYYFNKGQHRGPENSKLISFTNIIEGRSSSSHKLRFCIE